MERAILLFEYGNGLSGRLGNEALVEASRIYTRLEVDFPKRATVQYRLAKVLDALGDSKAATHKLEQLIENLESSDLPERHWVRAAAPRYLGVLYWEEGRRAALEPRSEDDPWPAESRKQFGRAYQVTKPILELDVDESGDPNRIEGVSERETAINNLLYYAVELTAGEQEERNLPEYGYVVGELRSFLDEMEASTSAAADDFRHLDTQRRAYRLLKDKPKARNVSERMVAALEERGILNRPGGGREEELLRAALETLAWCEQSDGDSVGAEDDI
jgi:hypothetical protein